MMDSTSTVLQETNTNCMGDKIVDKTFSIL